MKVYLCASFTRRQDAQVMGVALRAFGHEIVSTWHDRPQFQDTGRMADDPRHHSEAHCRAAVGDLQEIDRCDLLVHLTDGAPCRGGRNVELGYALAQDWIQIAVVGPREHVFHHLESVDYYQDIDAFMAEIASRELAPAGSRAGSSLHMAG